MRDGVEWRRGQSLPDHCLSKVDDGQTARRACSLRNGHTAFRLTRGQRKLARLRRNGGPRLADSLGQFGSHGRLRACARGQHPSRPTSANHSETVLGRMTKHGGFEGACRGHREGSRACRWVEYYVAPRSPEGCVEASCGGAEVSAENYIAEFQPRNLYFVIRNLFGAWRARQAHLDSPSTLNEPETCFLLGRPAATVQAANVPDVAAAGPRRPDICTPMPPRPALEHWGTGALGEGPRMQGPPAMVPCPRQANARPRGRASSMT